MSSLHRSQLALILSLLLLPWLWTAHAQTPRGTKYAFLVACADYDVNHLRKLPYTVLEMQEFSDVLARTGFPAANIKFLHDKQADRRFLPEKARILKELDLLLARVEADDTLLVALNGHGVHFKGDNTGYFCPLDSDLAKRESMIAMDGADSLFARLQACKAKRKLILVNACRNDPTSAFFQAAAKIQVDDDDPEVVPQGIAALYSCKPGQKSYFYDTDDPRSKGRKRSLFFHHVIETWKGSYTEGGKVTLEDLFREVRRKTATEADDIFGQVQVPWVKRDYQGEWILGEGVVEAALSKYLDLDLGGGVKLKLARIEPGTFLMGSPAGEEKRDDDEFQHRVEISKPFYLGIHEVTQAQYQRIMGKNPSYFSAAGAEKNAVQGLNTDDFPVETVSWDDAMEFCRTVTNLPQVKGQGWLIDLPTEAEWEYACRAGTKTPFHFGDTISTDQANYDGDSTYVNGAKGVYRQRTVKAGSFAANAWGLYEMHGNVWEWCKDWYDQEYYKNSARLDPQGPGDGKSRVLRGGSWDGSPRDCRAANRAGYSPVNRSNGFGFRVVVRLSSRTQ